MTRPPRIIVGLSGGIDSAVAALLLQQAGHEVIGATLRFRPCGPDAQSHRRSCCGPGAVEQAAAVAEQLGIRHYVLDCHQAFAEQVLRPCWDALAAGRTPNPCVFCNAAVKFSRLLELAHDVDAEAVATGHYARVTLEAGRPALYRGDDPLKDQSYFLCALAPDQLRRIRFPLNGWHKTDLRRFAAEHGLCNARRRDSQDVCFAAAQGGFAEFLRLTFAAPARPGQFVDRQGRVLGEHAGIHLFTVGQRHGLGNGSGTPRWVHSIDAASGRVVLCDDPADLLAAGCRADNLRWLVAPAELPARCEAQTRYRQTPAAVTLVPSPPDGSRVQVRFDTPQAAVTPGQLLVLYRGNQLLGGGWITEALPAGGEDHAGVVRGGRV